MNNSTFKTRLIEEKEELQDKLNKLNAFLNGPDFKKIPSKHHRYLLMIQANAMTTYLGVLVARIEHLK